VRKFSRIKGTQDILPERVIYWREMESTIHHCMELFNYKEIRTPIFEQTELFKRSTGEYTDIVTKEMYSFQDRAKRSITLNPEMTPPILRAYIENNLDAKSPFHKLYYIAPLFRQENPQAGRLRQFTQFGAEAIGSESAEIDLETILLALEIFNRLKITGLNLLINSVGDPSCRANYIKILKQYVKLKMNQYCNDCRERYNKNPLRILDCKNMKCKELNLNAPNIIDHLCKECACHFDFIRKSLVENKIKFEINPRLVRGLDYYTRTVFEITSPDLGSQDAVCGGGRYDLLMEQLGGKPTPAVGFAAGMERLFIIMESQSLLKETDKGLDIFIACIGEKASCLASEWLNRFRSLGYKTDMDYMKRSLKSQMREANRQKSKIVLLIGENEIEKKEFVIKDMNKSEQNIISFTEIEKYLSEIDLSK
jgi:histidyl-tRNA synthetase